MLTRKRKAGIIDETAINNYSGFLWNAQVINWASLFSVLRRKRSLGSKANALSMLFQLNHSRT